MPTEFVSGPRGALETLVVGKGAPTTVFAHGFGASIASTRPYASGVGGTRVFFSFPSHGRSDDVREGWGYATFADELLAVADKHDARAALGVSMGAGAILTALLRDPRRFDRAVLVLPPAAAEPVAASGADDSQVSEGHRDTGVTEHYDRLLSVVQAGDVDGIQRELRHEVSPALASHPATDAWLKEQAQAFTRAGMAEAIAGLSSASPISNRLALQALTLPILILGQAGDVVHPAAVAESLGAALPNARVEIFDDAGLLFGHRDRVRELVTQFLAGASEVG